MSVGDLHRHPRRTAGARAPLREPGLARVRSARRAGRGVRWGARVLRAAAVRELRHQPRRRRRAPRRAASSRLISEHSDADRFVMGLLRACADAVLVGAGTMRGSLGTLWTAEQAYPPAAAFTTSCATRASGLDGRRSPSSAAAARSIPRHPAFEEGALVLTSEPARPACAAACRARRRCSRSARTRPSIPPRPGRPALPRPRADPL